MKIHQILYPVIGLTIAAASAQAVFADDDNQEEQRVSPQLEDEGTAPTVRRLSYGAYPWLHLDANKIEFNGADWGPLRMRVDATGTTPFRILLIGDSHIQGDGATGMARRMLQDRYGSAGRGLITPNKLANTNQPADYTITSNTTGWRTARLMKLPWASPMTFTGISCTPPVGKFDMTIRLKELPGSYQGFDRVKIYYGGITPEVESIVSYGREIEFTRTVPGNGCLELTLRRSVTSCTFNFRTPGETNMAGFELLNGHNGVEFSIIGNNGANFTSYMPHEIGRGVAQLDPDLIIVAMGINDAWGNLTDAQFVKNVDTFVRELQRACPDAKILLTTPNETQKRNGRTSAPRKRVADFREIIKKYCADNHIAVYDYYDVCGGDGSSYHWIKNDLYSHDNLHYNITGYTLMGQLLGDALIQALD